MNDVAPQSGARWRGPDGHRPRPRRAARAGGYTLVEVLVVVLLLAILATIAVPGFSNASVQARATMLREDLRILRAQVRIFRLRHDGCAPGYPGCDPTGEPTEKAFFEHMTMATTADGDVAKPGTDGYDYGPYLAQMPVNPVNDRASVQIVPDAEAIPESGDDSHGWIYHAATTTLKADAIGTDPDGTPYIEY